MAAHPILAVVLARNAAYRAAILIGYSQADASEYAAREAERVRKGRAA